MEVGKGQGYVMAQIHLSVVGEWLLAGIVSNFRPLTPLGAPATSIQDHDKCPSTGQCVGALWHSKDDLLHDTCCSRGGKLKEGGVEDFSSTGEVVTHGLADSSI